MRSIILALSVAPSMAFGDCPPLPERSERQDTLMQQLSTSADETEARGLNDQLWEIWTNAPDEIAQEILRRGMERRASYDFIGAVQDFTALIEYCPHYGEGYNQRAFVHFIRGEYDLALVDLNRSLEFTPDHVGSASGKALTLLHLGREAEGQIALRHALTLHPWLSERTLLRPLEDVALPDQETDL